MMQVEDRKVVAHDAATHRLALHLTSATLAVALAALLQKQAHAILGENTLHHRETLLVVSTSDAEAVPLELITEGVAIYFLGHPLVEERQQLLIVVNCNAFLRPVLSI